MNKQENNNQTIIEDLPVDEAQQDEVKGGLTGTANHGSGALRNLSCANT